MEYLIYPEPFKAELCRGFDPKQVAEVLHQKGMLQRSKSSAHVTVQAREPGAANPVRLYLLTPALLEGGEDD